MERDTKTEKYSEENEQRNPHKDDKWDETLTQGPQRQQPSTGNKSRGKKQK